MRKILFYILFLIIITSCSNQKDSLRDTSQPEGVVLLYYDIVTQDELDTEKLMTTLDTIYPARQVELMHTQPIAREAIKDNYFGIFGRRLPIRIINTTYISPERANVYYYKPNLEEVYWQELRKVDGKWKIIY